MTATSTNPLSPLGLYCHVPFCAGTCDFCAFYQVTPRRGDIERYLAGMERELGMVDLRRPVATVYWGGGTPGLLRPADILRLGRALRRRLASEPIEWSVETAPRSVTAGRLAALRELGVNRLSMGVQSFQPATLRSLGAPHTPGHAVRAFEAMRQAGFSNVNVDLIVGAPGQTVASLNEDLRILVELGPEHVSLYGLTVEPNTALAGRLSSSPSAAEDNRQLALLTRGAEFLAAHGFSQYEISNFARPGCECRHNLHTWRMGDWHGLGPAAASQFGGRRGENVADLDQWEKELRAGLRATSQATELPPLALAIDRLVFGIRMNAGVSLAPVRATLPSSCHAALGACVTNLRREGFAELDDDTLRLTAAGRLVADRIGVELLSCIEP